MPEIVCPKCKKPFTYFEGLAMARCPKCGTTVETVTYEKPPPGTPM